MYQSPLPIDRTFPDSGKLPTSSGCGAVGPHSPENAPCDGNRRLGACSIFERAHDRALMLEHSHMRAV